MCFHGSLHYFVLMAISGHGSERQLHQMSLYVNTENCDRINSVPPSAGLYYTHPHGLFPVRAPSSLRNVSASVSFLSYRRFQWPAFAPRALSKQSAATRTGLSAGSSPLCPSPFHQRTQPGTAYDNIAFHRLNRGEHHGRWCKSR